MKLQACQFDYEGYIVDYDRLGIPISDFIINDCGTMIFFNSADNKCVPTEVIKTPVMLPQRFDECDGKMGNGFSFSVGSGMFVRQECEIPKISELPCFSGDQTIVMATGEIKFIRDIRIGDIILAVNSDGDLVYSSVVAVPHKPNNYRAAFNKIRTLKGHTITMTPSHLIHNINGPCTSALEGLLPLVKANGVDIGSCILTVDGIDEVVENVHTISYGLYTVVAEDEYLVVNGIFVSPFAESHALGSTFYTAFYRRKSFLFDFLTSKDENGYRDQNTAQDGALRFLSSILSSASLYFR